jgi:hypothetical protein
VEKTPILEALQITKHFDVFPESEKMSENGYTLR